MDNIREIALDTLLALEKEEAFSHRLLRDVLDKYDYLDPREKGFLKRVIEGTTERRIELDYYLDHYSSVPVKKMKPLIRVLMRMSVYQLLYMDGVPDSAVCNEACKLASKRKFQNLKGFVNAVLRKIAREKEHLPMPDPQKENLAYLCVRYSMPEWIAKMWYEQYGQETTETILKGLLEIHPVSVRVTAKGRMSGEESLKKNLQKAGIVLKENPCMSGMYWIRDVDGLGNLAEFQEGKLTVQDMSSVLAVQMAGIREGDFVIDVCAAPGGKTVLAAELAGRSGKVFAGDVSDRKVDMIRENLQRMEQEQVQVRVWDGREPEKDLFGKADVVLLDVPCSGLGVMGKKRDIKYRVKSEGLAELEELQKEIVRNAWQYVRPGGILLYSTCTIRREENQDMVEWILKELPFEPAAIREELPAEVSEGIRREQMARRDKKAKDLEECSAQLLPGVLMSDGFFFAKLRRNG